MSVQDCLGIPTVTVDSIISSHWPQWAADHPELPPDVSCRRDLRRLLQSGCPAQTERIIRVLGMLAHVDDYDDLDAAMVLADAMIPAAVLVACQLRWLTPDIDAHAAAHLWIQVRTIPWRGQGRIGIGLKWRLWRHLQVELLPMAAELRATLDSSAPRPGQPGEAGSDDEELLELFSLGLRSGELSSDDLDLLVAVLDASATLVPNRARGAGLMSHRVSGAVAPVQGADPRTIRRRTRRCIDTLRRLASA